MAIRASRKKFIACASAVLVSLASGCAHVPTSGEGSHPRTVAEIIRQNTPSGQNRAKYKEIVIRGVRLKNTDFDFPITINSRVEQWVDYFTGRGRKHFAKYLERSEFFVPYIVPLLKQNGMPTDLVYQAMIESGFNNFARSHAKAVGPWQFISGTGKRYGLAVNWWLDERRDVRKSTLAAIEYMKDLYVMFQSWELASAAYNAGEAKIARAIQRYGSRDFWVLSRQRYLRPETRNYVPKIIAAALIAKNREQFGFPASGAHPGSDEAVAPDGELVKLIKTDKPEEMAIDRTEEELEKAQELPAQDSPEGTDKVLAGLPTELAAEQEIEPVVEPEVIPTPVTVRANADQPLAKPAPTPHITKTGQVGGEELVEFDVQSPADLLKIARAAGLSYQTVKALNPELLRWCTPPNAKNFRIKLPASAKDQFLETYNHEAYPREIDFTVYKVRPGETLARIARRFGIRTEPLTDLNGVSPKSPLRAGAKILLPIPNDRTRSLASLEVRDPPERRRIRRYRRKPRSYKVTYKRREAARVASDNSGT